MRSPAPRIFLVAALAVASSSATDALELDGTWHLDESATLARMRSHPDFDADMERYLPALMKRMRSMSYRFDGPLLVARLGDEVERFKLEWVERGPNRAEARTERHGQTVRLALILTPEGTLRIESDRANELAQYVWRRSPAR